MQITSQEIEKTLNQYEKIDKPIIVKRQNKQDVIILSMKEYEDRILKNDIIEKLKKSEKEIENGEGIDADIVFRELRQKYGY